MIDYILVFHIVVGTLDFLTLFGLVTIRKLRWRWLTVVVWGAMCLLTAICFNPYRHGEFALVSIALWIHVPILLTGVAILRTLRDHRIGQLTPGSGLFRSAMILLAVGIFGVGYYANRIEPYRLEVTTRRIASPKILEMFRIVFATVFHFSHVREYERLV
ncbi:MAG: hypothetical protein Q4C47_06720, partial [Planctomycetia bacterium]|nr:hypothetical protein [Planctomycetia bacterium]